MNHLSVGGVKAVYCFETGNPVGKNAANDEDFAVYLVRTPALADIANVGKVTRRPGEPGSCAGLCDALV